jgi:hypothetical protein
MARDPIAGESPEEAAPVRVNRYFSSDHDHFQVLYHEVEAMIYVAKRGQKRVIGLYDDYVLFMHWLRSASPIDAITTAFDLRSPTLNTHLHKTGKAIHKVLVDRHTKSQWESPRRAPVKYPEPGLIIDATVRKRGRPPGSFEEAKRFFSGEH